MMLGARSRSWWRTRSWRALLHDSLLAGMGAAAARLFLFALAVLVSRSVADPRLFGMFSSVLLGVQLVAMFAGLGLAQSAAQAIAAAEGNRTLQDRTVRSTLALAFAGSVLASIALLVASRIWHLEDVLRIPSRDLVVGAAVLLAAQLFVGALEGILRGLRRFRVLCLAGCATSVLSLGIAIPLVRTLGVEGGILAATAFLVLQGALFLLPLASRLRGDLLPVRDLGHLLGLTVAPTFLNGLAWNLGMFLPPLMLVRAHAGLEQLAMWNAAGQIRTLVSFAPIVIANAAIPRLAAAYSDGDAWRREARSSVLLSMGAALVPFLPVALAAGPLMAVYGPSYGDHGPLLILVASFVLLQVLGSSLFVILLSARRIWQTAALNIAWSVSILLLAPKVIAAGGVESLASLYLWSYSPVLVALALLVAHAVRSVARRPHDVSRAPSSRSARAPGPSLTGKPVEQAQSAPPRRLAEA